MEIVEIVTKIALAIGAIYGAVKGIHALARWLRTWKILRRKEFDRLKAIEAKKYQPDIQDMRKRSAELGDEVEANLNETERLLESNRIWRAWNSK